MASFTEKKKTNINTKNTNKKQQQQTNKQNIYKWQTKTNDWNYINFWS